MIFIPYCETICSGQTGVASAIVDTLKYYNHEVPIGFIAKKLGQDRKTIDIYLIELAEKKVVVIKDQMVALIGPREKE